MRNGEEYVHLHTADQISLGCPAWLIVKDTEWGRLTNTPLPALGLLLPTAETDFPKSSLGK